ncbi:MAG: AraC family transcriptional regulator [bacterium]|nr:AraC family transcriptional regulator [bacterium]
MNLVTAILGFVVSAMLLLSASRNQFVNIFLGVGFFAMAYRSLSNYIIAYQLMDNTFLVGHVSFVYYFIGPSIYLYFRSVLNDEQSLSKRDWLHFLLPVWAILLLLYYLIEGSIIFGKFYLQASTSVSNNVTPYSFYLQPIYHVVLIVAQCFIYTVLSWRLVHLKLKTKKNEHPQLKKVRTWIITFLSSFTLLLIIAFTGAFLKIVFNIEKKFLFNVDFVRSVFLIYLFTRVLFKNDLLYGMPNLKTELPVIDSLPPNELEEPIDKENSADTLKINANSVIITTPNHVHFDSNGWIKPHEAMISEVFSQISPSGTLETDKVLDYINRINEYLEKKPYTSVDFDIKSICTELKAPLYHIEYLFRYYNKYSFSEFRNVMRVNYVLKQFEAGSSQNFTIEAIGLNAGFSSRSSFFRVFKQITEKTPKQVSDYLLNKDLKV